MIHYYLMNYPCILIFILDYYIKPEINIMHYDSLVTKETVHEFGVAYKSDDVMYYEVNRWRKLIKAMIRFYSSHQRRSCISKCQNLCT